MIIIKSLPFQTKIPELPVQKTFISLVLAGMLLMNIVVSAQTANSQIHLIDSLKNELKLSTEDSIKSKNLTGLCFAYLWYNTDSAMVYAEENMLLANKSGNPMIKAIGLIILADVLEVKGNYSQALNYGLQAYAITQKLNDAGMLTNVCWGLADIYKDEGSFDNAIQYAKIAMSKASPTSLEMLVSVQDMAEIHERFNNLDSSLLYIQKAYELDSLITGRLSVGDIALIFGNIFYKKKDYLKALYYYQRAIPLSEGQNIYKDLIDIHTGIARTQLALKHTDSSITHARRAVDLGRIAGYPLGVLNATKLLSDIYKAGHNTDSLIHYMEQTSLIKDSIFNQQKITEVENLSFNEKLRQEEIVRARKTAQERIAIFSLLGGLIFFLAIALLLYRNNVNKQRAFALLQKQKNETDNQKAIAEKTLLELKTTQTQLIHSEKMASLGELTAGIAHEIENPLNFVNNFSELNLELIEEVKDEMHKANLGESGTLLKNIQQNLEKITAHGRKADLIVKGMLQHSRTGSGKKEATDINALVEEWLRLSYSGMRARNKSFECKTRTELDSTVGLIAVVPQDLGRVLQNLFGNAYYSISEKLNKLNGSYEPELKVRTQRLGDEVVISVKDNGMGISSKNKDKIFQPFFTTKPPGQGTGLGLSIIYDIISKEHGGTINVESEEGQFAEFIIKLPAEQ